MDGCYDFGIKQKGQRFLILRTGTLSFNAIYCEYVQSKRKL